MSNKICIECFRVSWYTKLSAIDCSDECFKFMNGEMEKNVVCIGRGLSVARTYWRKPQCTAVRTDEDSFEFLFDFPRIKLGSTTTNTSCFDAMHSSVSHSQPVKHEITHCRTFTDMKSHMSLYCYSILGLLRVLFSNALIY